MSRDERILAEFMMEVDGLVGAARAHRYLTERGASVSQATVSRMLLRLDELGMTESVGRSGRKLTEAARLMMARASQHRRRNQLIDDIFDEADRSELIDLLELRKVIEAEASALACDRSDAKDHLAMLTNLAAYDEHSLRGGDFSRDAIEFHVLLCRATHSAPYALIAEALYPEMHRLEPLVVAAAHKAGEKSRSSGEHASIARAVMRGDAEQSRRLTVEHFDTMIRWLSGISESDFVALIREVGGGVNR
ncbi:MAG TPA: FCD domain-containing protein [Candidatus Agrococcus pullicola]|uniref:FCD domain-containing protein n=1 Tax=Candidatus Agrococcus pullicola TaxID=2838429 RepID=A0A9D2C8K5_9MICO|nr:FCD domain-containing protein [Candidatus Agrococcus pullicola]